MPDIIAIYIKIIPTSSFFISNALLIDQYISDTSIYIHRFPHILEKKIVYNKMYTLLYVMQSCIVIKIISRINYYTI